MKKSNLIGLAAPQVGVPLQIFVIHFPHPYKYFSKEEITLKDMEHVKNQVSINNVHLIIFWSMTICLL